jgi:hypothetical protein
MHGGEITADSGLLIFVKARPARNARVVTKNLAEDRSWRRGKRICENASFA